MVPTNIVNRVYNVAAYGAISGDGIDNTAPIQEALSAALQDGGELYFPPGVWEFNESLNITSTLDNISKIHRIRGSGWRSELKYVGDESAIKKEGDIHGLKLQDFKLTGNDKAAAAIDFAEESPANGVPPREALHQVTIENLFIHHFSTGYGIKMSLPYSARIIGNRIFNTKKGIYWDRGIGGEIRSNWVRHWTSNGIQIEGNTQHPNPGLSTLAINNTIVANIVDIPFYSSDENRAAICLEEVISNKVEGNYFECLGNRIGRTKCAEGFPHGIMIKGTVLSQSNTITGNFFSPENGFKIKDGNHDPEAGYAIYIGEQGSKSLISGNHLGDFIIWDEGPATSFMMQFAGGVEGQSTTRRGWIQDSNGVTQYHP